MKIRFACPGCERPSRLTTSDRSRWQCPDCKHSLPSSEIGVLSACAVCGNPELYRKKDFPHWLGVSILFGACALFLALHYSYHQWLAWAVLIGSALVDGGLYLLVGDVIVCYRCGAEYRGVSAGAEHKPHEIVIAERYRQERLRRPEIRD